MSNDRTIGDYVDKGPEVMVGDMVLRELNDGAVWMENADGEGMAVKGITLVRLEAKLIEFFEENH